jgi:hypothetical protein
MGVIQFKNIASVLKTTYRVASLREKKYMGREKDRKLRRRKRRRAKLHKL